MFSGIGLSAIPVIIHSLIADYYEPSERGAGFGWVGFGMALGGVFGALYGENQHDKFGIEGWKLVFFVVGGIGSVFCIILSQNSLLEDLNC